MPRHPGGKPCSCPVLLKLGSLRGVGGSQRQEPLLVSLRRTHTHAHTRLGAHMHGHTRAHTHTHTSAFPWPPLVGCIGGHISLPLLAVCQLAHGSVCALPTHWFQEEAEIREGWVSLRRVPQLSLPAGIPPAMPLSSCRTAQENCACTAVREGTGRKERLTSVFCAPGAMRGARHILPFS